jgi:hypothetical protein
MNKNWSWWGLALSLAACAGVPRGRSSITSESGRNSGFNYLTQEELIRYVNKKYKDETDREIELKMIPVGGKSNYRQIAEYERPALVLFIHQAKW